MQTSYFERWSIRRGEGLSPLTVDEARSRHEKGEAYVAVTLNAEGTKCALKVAPDWVGVYFVDTCNRNFLFYDFRKWDDGRLFLKGAIHREFHGETRESAACIDFNFDPSGEILMSRAENGSEFGELRQAWADASINWENYSDFGKYERLCVQERQEPAVSADQADQG